MAKKNASIPSIDVPDSVFKNGSTGEIAGFTTDPLPTAHKPECVCSTCTAKEAVKPDQIIRN